MKKTTLIAVWSNTLADEEDTENTERYPEGLTFEWRGELRAPKSTAVYVGFSFRSKVPERRTFLIQTEGDTFVVKQGRKKVDHGVVVSRRESYGLYYTQCKGNRFKSFELTTYNAV